MTIFKNIILRDQYTGYGGGGGSNAPSEAQQSITPSSTPTSPSSTPTSPSPNTSYSGEAEVTQESKDILPVDKDKDKTKIPLSKNVYDICLAYDELDEEFNQFLPNQYTIGEFFNIYNTSFYRINKNTHIEFIQRSTNNAFPEGYLFRRDRTINNLQLDIKEVIKRINSIERHHPLLPNRIVLVKDEFKNAPVIAAITNRAAYYLQSGVKRQILTKLVYDTIKSTKRAGLPEIADSEFVVYIPNDALHYISNGPDIGNIQGLDLSFLEINTYNSNTLLTEEESDVRPSGGVGGGIGY